MKIHRLRELLLIKNGKDHSLLSDGEIPVYGSGGIMRYASKSIYNDESILLPRKGTLSNIQYVNKPFWSVDTIYYTIVNKDLANPFFLFNYLKSLDLSNLNTGTGVPSMTFESYYNLEIQLPSISIQKNVASVLSALDSKIELNNRINAELEQMAKTIYDYWFVQFDFPMSAEYAASVGQPELVGKPYKSSGGRMVWSGELKREVPEGWEVKSLGDVVEIKYGKDHKDVGIGLIPVYGSGGIMRFGDRAIYEKESILIPRKGTLSNLFYLDKPFWSVDTMFYTKMKVLKSGKYLFYTLERMKLASLNVGTAVPSLTTEVLNKLNTLFPSCDIISRFDDILIPTFAHKTRNIIENQKLTELRDWLLPMLMNGQVKVGVVEEEIHDIFYN
jgi:type I restriction enzyme, S subunit